jgi:hypothetical protein
MRRLFSPSAKAFFTPRVASSDAHSLAIWLFLPLVEEGFLRHWF